jgi:putative Holliday junction resolvase
MNGAIVGIDLGSRRIGLAISEDGLVARPLATITRGADAAADAAAITRLLPARALVELVVGLPLHASGAAGTMADEARAWAAAVGAVLAVPVRLRDERLSSHVAEGRLGPIGRGRSGGPPSRARRDAYRARVDREAAAVILQDELDARRAEETS